MLPETTPAKSPLEELSTGWFKGHTYAQEKVFNMTTNRDTLLSNNPNRVFWAAINEGSQDVHLSTDPAITNTSGWLLPAGGGVIIMDWEHDGESVGYAVYAICGTSPNNVRVREVIRS